MLSNKMTVSLMSLITIFALAFIASPALAFDVTLAVKTLKDATSDDDFQVDAATTPITITATADEALSAPTGTDGVTTRDAAFGIVGGTGTLTHASLKVYELEIVPTSTDAGDTVTVYLRPDSLTSLATGTKDHEGSSLTIKFVNAEASDHDGVPQVYEIKRWVGAGEAAGLMVENLPVAVPTFGVRILLSEKPKEFKKDKLDVSNATVLTINALAAIAAGTPTTYLHTGRDASDALMLYPYLATIQPKYEKTDDIVIKVKEFEDIELSANKFLFSDTANVDKLTVKVDAAAVTLADQTPGTEIKLPKEIRIPTGGFLIVAEDEKMSYIELPAGSKKDAPKATERKEAQRLYNVITIDALTNLETFLSNGGTIDLVGPKGVIISEIMWGSNFSLDMPYQSQWIEIMNTTAADIVTGDGDYKLIFYNARETLPAVSTVKDRVSTGTQAGGYWSITSKGQNGRTDVDKAPGDVSALTPTQAVVSMQRVMAADGTYMDGTMATGWVASTPPTANFTDKTNGLIIATPGAAPFISAVDTAAAEKAAADKKAAAEKAIADAAAKTASTGTYPKVGDGRVYISEVMFAGGGTLPQWIEIANGDRAKEFNLSGWTLTVDNAIADADVSVGARATFTIPDGTKIMPSSQNDMPSTILIVTEKGRNNLTGPKASGQVINLSEDNEVELILAGVLKGKYTLLSDMAFLITLAPPTPEPTKPPTGETAAAKTKRQAMEKAEANIRKAAMDMAGNLGKDGAAAWALPMNAEGGRSSIIRKHIQVARGPSAPEDGMMAENWALASDTSFAQVTHIRASSYYGAANDVGTPGFRAGGALPVQLSHFRPARDKATGAAVITWATQSELNNAGFFIKRSQQKDGEFQVINATMVAGAGTTSEKQFYTYTDTTAQPNVVYYYQIEDVSLDGQRQTLTRGIRLKGHVGAAGKATTLWGELKTSHE